MGEQAEHATVIGQHVSAELEDSPLSARAQDLLQENRSQTEPLPSVLHDERDLGDGWPVRGLKAGDTDHHGVLAPGRLRDYREAPLVVDVREVARQSRRQRFHPRKEPLVGRVDAETIVERHEPWLIVRTDRTKAHTRTVAERDGVLELFGVAPRMLGD